MQRRFPTSIILSILFLAAVLGVASGRGRQESAPSRTAPLPIEGLSAETPAAPQVPPPLAGGPAPDLVLVFTSQVAGWIEPCG